MGRSFLLLVRYFLLTVGWSWLLMVDSTYGCNSVNRFVCFFYFRFPPSGSWVWSSLLTVPPVQELGWSSLLAVPPP